MRDPMTWAVPLFRLGGVPVRLHVVFIVFAVGLVVRQIQPPAGVERPVEILLFTGPLLFLVALAHEAGRLAAARFAGGDCPELVVWPLGGLVPADVPHDGRAHALAALGGPAANLLVCMAGSLVLVVVGFLPNLNPLADPYVSEMRNYRDGRLYTSEFAMRLYEPGTPIPVKLTDERAKLANPSQISQEKQLSQKDHATAPRLLVWVNRTVWLSWVMLLLNLLPGRPLDFGWVLHGLGWWRSDSGRATTVAGYAGYVVGGIAVVASLGSNEVSPLLLGMVVGLTAWAALHPGDGGGGYGDFSEGYSSLDQSDPPPRTKRQPFVKRWLTARAAKRIHKENAERQRDDDRMDQLLDKIGRSGKESLTDEERRFMQRVAARYKNR